MKILIDARLYGLENAGLGRYVINLVEELKNPSTPLSAGLRDCRFVILLRKRYFNILKFPKNWKKVEADYRHYSLLEQIKLPLILYREKPDLVHFPHFNVPVLYRGKYVVTIHDMLMHKSKGKEGTTLPIYKYYLKRLVYGLVFNQAVLSSSRVIVPSQSVKNELLEVYKISPEKIVVTYEGVDKNTIRYSKAREKLLNEDILPGKYLIYVGNAYPHKNLKIAIKAVKELNQKQIKKIILLIASSRNVFIEKLEKNIKNLEAERYVKLLGFVPDEQLGILLKNSTAFIFPSLNEGFGLPGLEAMEAGTLVLASDIPVFKEVYADNAIYFDPRDVESIKNVVKKAIDMDETERKKKIVQAKKFIKKYSWSKMAQETLNLYESCLGIRSGE